ncbi:hypothetical protein [Candidatus Enterococcus ferrettii]|uniref:Uncharacterized protein n=1 Tax=Candidatus Enterococcus ferrettii TaxID=2815324 RepID=A0ABV0EJZ1_9ENTE|nr:hypothetical protein [Enterococcus sp. 665A]MBO1338291.1 hypothetical protein [Enterococcus sp. 665A]
MDIYSIQQIAFAGLACTGILLLLAILTRITKGLFLARFPHEFIKDSTDPKYELERQAGKKFSHFILKYIPPFFIGFLIILLLTYLY